MMINFLCRTLVHNHGRYGIRASLVHNKFQDFLCPIFIKYISSSSKETSFTVSYLINSCGLSPESALKASERVQFETPEKADLVLALFKNIGFSQNRISELIRKCPLLLVSNPEKTLLPKLEFFHSKGVSIPDLVTILCSCPYVLQRSLKNHIIPSFNYLNNLLQSSEKAITAIKRFPIILHRDLQIFVAPKVNLLRDNGVPGSNIVMLLHKWPSTFVNYSSRFEETVDFVKKMGINPLRSQFVVAIVIMLIMDKSEWDKKFDLYNRWGWSEEEILTAFRKNPWCMLTSEDKIMAVMDLFVNKMGWEASAIAKRSILVSFSMEKRIIPRASVLQYLLSKGLLKNNPYNPVTSFRLSDEIFCQRFVNCYDEAPQLMKLYREKLDLSKMTK